MLTYEERDSVAVLALNRPESGNAIDHGLEIMLSETLSRVVENDAIRVIVVEGAGDGAFSEGEDWAELSKGPQIPTAETILPHIRPYWQTLIETDRISVAAIRGKCFGRGLELALACDIRIATEDSLFCLPQASLGTIPSAGGTQLLPRTIPRGLAMEMILASRTIDAQEAYRIGLVNKVVKPDELSSAKDQVVNSLLSMAPIALKYAKEAISKGLDLTLEQGMRLEADLSALLQTTDDRKEGIKSFLERRPPQFTGK